MACIYHPSDLHKLRTTEKMNELAANAVTANSPQYGVKGKSVLAEHIKFPQCIPVDYMHLVLESVFKQLMKLWFSPSFCQESYSMRKDMSTNTTINKLM